MTCNHFCMWHVIIVVYDMSSLYMHVSTFNQAKVMLCCSVLQCVAVCCSVLQCATIVSIHSMTPRRWSVAVCCSALQQVAVMYMTKCCRKMHIATESRQDDGLLLCVAVSCSMLQSYTYIHVCTFDDAKMMVCCSVLQYAAVLMQCVAVCCSNVHDMYVHLMTPRWCSVAVCCSVLQCVAVCCSVCICWHACSKSNCVCMQQM